LSHIIRCNCPDSEHGNFVCHDTDYKLFNKITKRMMIIEEKTNGGIVTYAEKIDMKRTYEAWKLWCDAKNWNFLGVFVIELFDCKKEFTDDIDIWKCNGDITIHKTEFYEMLPTLHICGDNKISEKDLIKLMSMED